MYDNAQNFDKFSLGQELEYPDRLGVPRKSLAGIRAEVTEALSRLGYQVIGDYAAGLVVQNYGQVFRKDGEFYRAKAETALPYPLNGSWAVDAPKFVSVGDAVLRQELAAPDGATLVGGLIANNLTINVPADQPTIAGAMSWLRERTIARGATVTIQVSDGSHAFTPPLDLNHPQGGQIEIIGNQADKSACVLLTTGEPTENGFVVSDGHQFGLVDGLELRCSVKATAVWQGIVALRGASLTVGPNVTVDNWYYGIVGRDGGSVAADGVVVKNAGDVGFWAFAGGHLRCRNASVENVRDTSQGLGFGFQAEYGSSMDCSSASATQCLVAGIAALSGSTVRAYSASSTGNDGDGLLARDGGVIVAHGATTTGNSGYGIGQRSSGRVFGNSINTASNTLGVNRPAAILDNDALGARVLATGGPLRIDTGLGGFGHSFHTSGGRQLEILHIEGAVNYPYLAGSASGSPARLGVSGSDANIDLRLRPKGAGVVRFGSHVEQSDVPITGYITVKDDTGALRKLAVIS
ncbi:TPA: hypothetical protein NHP85_006846 [Pseudomonas aeruginosa]|nr:hypothetical protein [Pseudomonas aeruginosa]